MQVTARTAAAVTFTAKGASARSRKAALARAASGRRRMIDPTTCERDYSSGELVFMNAMQEYKRAKRRPFPTWSEALEVLLSLGYTPPPAGVA